MDGGTARGLSPTGISALPPSSVPPNDGGSYYVCNVFEWAAATLKHGESCWFRKRLRIGEPELGPWKRGSFKMSWMYDGIIAVVFEDDPDDYIEYSLFLDMGDQLVRPEDRETLLQWEALPR